MNSIGDPILKFEAYDRTFGLALPDEKNPKLKVRIHTNRTIVFREDSAYEMQDAIPEFAATVADYIIKESADGSVSYEKIRVFMDWGDRGVDKHPFTSMVEGQILEQLIKKGHGCKAYNLRGAFEVAKF